MRTHISIDEARAIERKPVAINNTYTFYSDCVGCISDNEAPIRRYSGRQVKVLEWINKADCEAEALQAALWIANNPEGEWEWENTPQYKVQVEFNGDIFQANESELNGWIFDTGQWVGPRVN